MVQFDAGLGDQKKKSPVSAMTVVGIAAICGILSIVCYLVSVSAGAVVFGAIGLVVGGFSFGRAFTAEGDLRKVLTALVAVGLILSVIGFMLGFAGLIG